MKYFLFAVAAVSLTAVASVPAYAQESNADLAFAGVPAQVRSGGLLPNGGDGVLQTANSLPLGWAQDMASQQYAQAVNRYYAQQTRTASQTAQVSPTLTRP